MQNNAEYLLSEEVISQIKKPYFSMNAEEKEQLKKLRNIYIDLTSSEKNLVKEKSDEFVVAKLTSQYLDYSLDDVTGEMLSYIQNGGRFWGDFSTLKEFCFSNNIDFNEMFGDLYGELSEVVEQTRHNIHVPIFEIESVKKCVEKYFELRGEEYRKKYILELIQENDFFDGRIANILAMNTDLLEGLELNESQRVSFLFHTSKTGILEFLKTQPEKYIYTDYEFRLGPLINHLSDVQINELFGEIDDSYKAKLLLSANIAELSQLFPYLSGLDEYMQMQIVCAKHKDSSQSVEFATEKIDNYSTLKSKMLELPEEERANFLLNLDYTSELSDIGGYEDVNDIKRSLLNYIDNAEDRDNIIQSMTRYVAPELEEYVGMAEQMIEEFFDNHCELSMEEKERMKMALKINFELESYAEDSTRGTSYNLKHLVTISSNHMEDPNSVIFYVLHEMSHILSLSNFRKDAYNCGNTFEEGIADVFAQSVLTEYLDNHGELELGGGIISKENLEKALEETGYKFENGWIRSMLYALEQQGMDFLGIKEFLLGKKETFFEMVLGKEFMERFSRNHNGEPENVGFRYEDLYGLNSQYFQQINTNSIYYDMNYILPGFIMQERCDEDIIGVMGRREFFNNVFIDKTYFGGRKLYEVSYDEYSEFSELYKRANLSNEKYIQGKGRYIVSKYRELTEEDIQRHGAEIVEALAGLLQSCENDMSRSDELGVGKTLSKAIRSAKSKLRNPENIEAATRLKQILECIDYSKMEDGVFALEFDMLEGVVDDLKDYIDRGTPVKPKTTEERLVEAVGDRAVTLDEVKSAGMRYAFENSHKKNLEETITH